MTIKLNGMTNKSTTFEIDGKTYILRIPGEGTSQLINRKQEFEAYQATKHLELTDNVVSFDENTGIKITEYIEDGRNCDPYNKLDIMLCMKTLREFHKQKLVVSQYFDFRERIEFYENLMGKKSKYENYDFVKSNILWLLDWIDTLKIEHTLCHIDPNQDNFLIDKHSRVYLLDWEYAAMQDPDVDIAMFALYAQYTYKEVIDLIDAYYTDYRAGDTTRIKIFAYIAIAGLLWSNWTEYKETLGVTYGNYGDNQFKFAEEYSKLVRELLRTGEYICKE